MEEKNQEEYVNSLLRIIKDELPIIYKFNQHLHQNIRSAIELVLDQSQFHIQESVEITEETKKEVDKLIEEIGEI